MTGLAKVILQEVFGVRYEKTRMVAVDGVLLLTGDPDIIIYASSSRVKLQHTRD